MKVMVMAGGTGGHVFPALAIAHELRARGHEVVWMGAPASFEARTVVPQGFALETIRVAGLRGKGWRQILGAPVLLWIALRDAMAVLSRQRPDVVLGMGGFAAGPGGLAARLQHLPLVVHEQNAAPGFTNRLLARIADRVLEAFPRTFSEANTVGNPVRAQIAQLPEPGERLTGRTGPARVLVLGGSQGALALNRIVPQALALLPPGDRPQVWHQAGRTLEVARSAYAAAGVVARIEPFIDDMPAAYGWADLVICRAGASTIAELCAAGCASVLVPFPYAVDDHQTANARYLSDAGAAVLVQERELDSAGLANLLKNLLLDRAQLLRMAEAARRKAWPEATKNIVAQILTLAGLPC